MLVGFVEDFGDDAMWQANTAIRGWVSSDARASVNANTIVVEAHPIWEAGSNVSCVASSTLSFVASMNALLLIVAATKDSRALVFNLLGNCKFT